MRRVEHDDPRTPSVQIADDLRAQIAEGELAPGSRLLSGRALARQYGVALMTVQTALRRLRDEGRLYSTGRGYFVCDPDQPPPGDGSDGVVRRLDALEADVRDLRTRIETLESDR
jgi:DNA-binding GntR family transcriptional regulator